MSTVPDKRCDNGHVIDASWDLCPYCPQEKSAGMNVVRPKNTALAEALPSAPRREKDVEEVVRRGGTVDLALPPSPPAVVPVDRTVTVQKADVAPAHRYVVGWLVGLSGAIKGESFPVRSGRNILGRDRKSDVVINDDQASAHHADLVFRPDEKRYILMDHNSTNGTYVNDVEIEPRRDLFNKDVIRIGGHKFMFCALCHDGFSWEDQDQRK